MTSAGSEPEGSRSPGNAAAAAASREIVRLELPEWLRTLGTGAWLIVGLIVLIGAFLLLLALIAPVLVPLVIAAVLASILVPVVDRLERWRIPRWLGSVMLLLAGVAVAIGLVVLVGRLVVAQGGLIWAELTAGLDAAGELVVPGSELGLQFVALLQATLGVVLAGALGSLVSSATLVLVGVVLGLFMLLFLLTDWIPITTWLTRHIGLPVHLAEDVLAGTVRAFRGYALGLTEIGLANAAVVGLGAVLLQLPGAVVIVLVTFVASYVPYFGAFLSGALAVFVALGTHDLPTALVMLAIVVLANTTIQNLLEPFAYGRSLRLHPLAILITTTGGALLFGLMGAILAAPLTSAAVNALRLLTDAGFFDPPGTAEPSRPSDPPWPDGEVGAEDQTSAAPGDGTEPSLSDTQL